MNLKYLNSLLNYKKEKLKTVRKATSKNRILKEIKSTEKKIKKISEKITNELQKQKENSVLNKEKELLKQLETQLETVKKDLKKADNNQDRTYEFLEKEKKSKNRVRICKAEIKNLIAENETTKIDLIKAELNVNISKCKIKIYQLQGKTDKLKHEKEELNEWIETVSEYTNHIKEQNNEIKDLEKKLKSLTKDSDDIIQQLEEVKKQNKRIFKSTFNPNYIENAEEGAFAFMNLIMPGIPTAIAGGLTLSENIKNNKKIKFQKSIRELNKQEKDLKRFERDNNKISKKIGRIFSSKKKNDYKSKLQQLKKKANLSESQFLDLQLDYLFESYNIK